MGVYKRKNKLWLRYKSKTGVWKHARTDFVVGQEKEAKKLLKKLLETFEVEKSFGLEDNATFTVESFAEKKWFEERRGLVSDWKSNEGWLRNHVFPKIGSMPIGEVKASHIKALFADIRKAKASPGTTKAGRKMIRRKLAPKSVHNIYGLLSALFRDAKIDGLVDEDPCILTERQLGPKEDADPEWRDSAFYSRPELQRLISDTIVPLDRRVMYALMGLGGLRHGEAAGLRWRHYETTMTFHELGKLKIFTSYDKGRTKTRVARPVPVHPVLASILAEWRLRGWEEMMGRKPTPDDLICPTSRPTNRGGPQTPLGSQRNKNYSRDRLLIDLKALGFRHRRGHDLRRTFTSLARGDGALKDVIRRVTHKPPKEVIEGYTSFEWEVVSEAVSKLQVRRETDRQVLSLAANSPKVLHTTDDSRHTLVTSSPQPPEITNKTHLTLPGFETGKAPVSDSGLAPNTSGDVSRIERLTDSRHRSSPNATSASRQACDDVTSALANLYRLAVDFGIPAAHPVMLAAVDVLPKGGRR